MDQSTRQPDMPHADGLDFPDLLEKLERVRVVVVRLQAKFGNVIAAEIKMSRTTRKECREEGAPGRVVTMRMDC